VEKFLI